MISALIVSPSPVPATFCRKERFQNLLLSFCWNSRTCVGDLYVETVHRSCDGEMQGSPVWHRINCVADQVCKDLPDITLQTNDWRHIVQSLPLNDLADVLSWL